MISLEEISKVYRTREVETLALEKVSLAIDEGEFVSIMGPSGCGKSTLLNIMGILDEPSAGKVILDGEEISSYHDRHIASLRNRKVGFIFQSFHLIRELDSFDNVELPLIYRKMAGKERKERVTEALALVGLANRKRHYPSQMSGGQCQRVAIARAIVGRPELLLADEPTGNLDSRMGREIMEILQRLNEQGTTIAMVTHDESLAGETGRIIRIYDGRLVN
ncbi:MAG: macrolide ABC transporter ATP-binding protein [Bacteroidetes bacterium]|nr:MAG: macrolide ABC transporter ATP-binding protein [Bacteroidota bacterium]